MHFSHPRSSPTLEELMRKLDKHRVQPLIFEKHSSSAQNIFLVYFNSNVTKWNSNLITTKSWKIIINWHHLIMSLNINSLTSVNNYWLSFTIVLCVDNLCCEIYIFIIWYLLGNVKFKDISWIKWYFLVDQLKYCGILVRESKKKWIVQKFLINEYLRNRFVTSGHRCYHITSVIIFTRIESHSI